MNAQMFSGRRVIFTVFVILVIFSLLLSAKPVLGSGKMIEITTSDTDTEYLRSIMKETFDSIMYYRHPVTGIFSGNPQNDKEMSKCDHIGIVFGCVAVGGKLGLISDEEARRELGKALDWLEKIPTASGFPAEPIRASDTTIGSTSWVAVADMGWYPCGLIVAAEAYPEFKGRIMKLIDAMDWTKMYNAEKGYLKGVYAVQNGILKAEGLDLILASDQRLAIFISIASGKVPPAVWDKMPRNYLERYGEKYMKPGEGLGYGEQPWDMGYYIDERGSEVGKSNADLAWVQMYYALDMWYPVWGWSNCLTLERYMGFGDPDTSWSSVNPHAIAPAIVFYPNQVVKAFRKMEELGVREPVRPDGITPKRFGFRASYDVDKKKSPEAVLAGLDQPMIFMSLANYLNDGIVWRLFRQNEMVERGIKSIREYATPNNKYYRIYKERDAKGPSIEHDPEKPASKTILVDDFAKEGRANSLGGGRETKLATVNFADGAATIEFMGGGKNKGRFTEQLQGIDLTHYRLIKLKIKGRAPGHAELSVRISGEGGYRPIPVTTEWNELLIPLRSMLGGRTGYNYAKENPDFLWTGMWHDRSDAQELTIEQMDIPAIEIKEISFIAATREEIDSAATALVSTKPTFIEADGTFDRMESAAGWFTMSSGHTSKVSVGTQPGSRDKGIVFNFQFTEKRENWGLMGRRVSLEFPDKTDFVFKMKATGGPANLEVKFMDSSGATYRTTLEKKIVNSDWQEVRIPIDSIPYAWGGIAKPRVTDAVEFHFAVTSGSAVQGTVVFDDLKIVRSASE